MRVEGSVFRVLGVGLRVEALNHTLSGSLASLPTFSRGESWPPFPPLPPSPCRPFDFAAAEDFPAPCMGVEGSGWGGNQRRVQG